MIKNNLTKKYASLYIIRHGETDWNIKGLMQGQTDVKLNQQGEEQAKILNIKIKDIHFSAFFSSDLLRAKKTLELATLEKKIAITTTKALRERSFGRFEGLPYREYESQLQTMLDKFSKLSNKEQVSFKLDPTVESDEELLGRLLPFLREVSVAYAGKNIMIVTHGGLMRTLLIHLGYITYATKWSISIDNTACFKLESDGVDFFVKEMWGINKV